MVKDNYMLHGGKRIISNYRHFILIGSFLILGMPKLGLAIGISPALVKVENILPNQTVSKEVHLSRANPESTISAQVIISGSAANYIEPSNNGVVEIFQGEQLVPYSFVINTQGLSSGSYQAVLAINPVSDAEDREDTKIMAGAQAEIQFTVTNEEIESYTVQEATMEGSEENQVVGFSYLMVNTGNVDTRPAKVDFSATDEADATNSYNETIDGQGLPLVPAFQEKQVDVITGASLSAGIYDTKITFYSSDNQPVYSADSIRLQVVGSQSTSSQKNESRDLWLLVAIVFLLIIILLGLWKLIQRKS